MFMVILELSGAVWTCAGTFGTTRNRSEPLGIVPNVLELAGTDRNHPDFFVFGAAWHLAASRNCSEALGIFRNRSAFRDCSDSLEFLGAVLNHFELPGQPGNVRAVRACSGFPACAGFMTYSYSIGGLYQITS